MSSTVEVKNLKTYFYTDNGVSLAVDDVSFTIPEGKILALVGESGCGKSVTALSLLRLIPNPPGKIVGGEILVDGRNILALSEKEMRSIRGDVISMIFQEPMTSLNPVFRIVDQMTAPLMLHRGLSRPEAIQETVQLLEQVGIPSPEERLNDYPHQMSGGMLQRVMIAMALACNPVLLIADEPTTALDVTIQAQIIRLMRDIQRAKVAAGGSLSILLITHDLGVVAEIADEVAIMYAGKIVEKGTVEAIFAQPKHPYTVGLFNSLPKMNEQRERLYTIPGQVPAATDFPAGCRFHPRCPQAMEICRKECPPCRVMEAGQEVSCWLYTGDEFEIGKGVA